MRTIPKKLFTGLTLIEVMVVVAIIVVAVTGTMSFRYQSVVQAKKADVQINAARLGEMLLETWKGMGGFSTYNPSAEFPLSTYGSQFTITNAASGPAAPTSFIPLANNYQVLDKANNAYYYVTLSYKSAASGNPLALNAVIVWRRDYTTGSVTDNDSMIKMTTYVN